MTGCRGPQWIEWAENAAGTAPDTWAVRQPDDGGPSAVQAPVESGQRRCLHLGHLDRLSGMNRFPRRCSLVVVSPSDYAVQDELRIARMTHLRRSPGFSDELCDMLPALLRGHQHGQLVLFTSIQKMQACHGALPQNL